MFDFMKKENLTQEQRLLKHLMKNKEREVTLSSIVVNRMERKKDTFWNFRSYYMLTEK